MQTRQMMMLGEISYDLIMEDEMAFIEGTFRINKRQGQVVIVVRRDSEEIEWRRGVWESGVSGVTFYVPDNFKLNKQSLEEMLTNVYGIEEWIEVRGPDSLLLR